MKAAHFEFSEQELLLDDGFTTENGEELDFARVTYHTAGVLNKERDNVVWICHALTANSDPGEWWADLFRENSWLSATEHFVICVNIPGSCYGTFGPLDLGNGTALYHDFPEISIRDIVKCLRLVADNIGISRIAYLIGASMGGQQAMEWAVQEPERIERLILLATNAKHSPWGIAFNESQRWAIENDTTWTSNSPDAGIDGMKVARSMALLSYRTYQGFHLTQDDHYQPKMQRKASSYQRYQGEKLAKRFNAFSYHILSKAMDSHDVSHDRESLENALQEIKADTLVLNLEGDVLFPLEEQEFLAQHIKKATLITIKSRFGHDGFLIETDQIKEVIQNWQQEIDKTKINEKTA